MYFKYFSIVAFFLAFRSMKQKKDVKQDDGPEDEEMEGEDNIGESEENET